MANVHPWAAYMDGKSLFQDLPHVIEAYKIIDQTEQGLLPLPMCFSPDYDRGKNLGLYDEPSDLDGENAKSWMAKKRACSVSSSLVGVYYWPGAGHVPWSSSGIIFEYCGVNKVVTAAYNVIGECRGEEVDLLLPNQTKSKGIVTFVDTHHNLAIIEANLSEFQAATFSSTLVPLDAEVTAVLRNYQFKLEGSVGRVDVRRDHLESDLLMCSNCSVSLFGIGGPLICNSTGEICGINFFSKRGCTPFLPSKILLKCIEHILGRGRVDLPWMGWKIRDLNELKMDEMESIYLKYNTLGGVLVKEVMKNSPADMAGICQGDIIHKFADHDINSPVELATILFDDLDAYHERRLRSSKRRATIEGSRVRVISGTQVKFVVVRRISPVVPDSWPLLRSD